MNDYFYLVRGILRKRSRYRCEKRGEDFEKYKEQIKEEQRAVGKPVFEKSFREALENPSHLFKKIKEEDTWGGGSLILPLPKFSKRKRAIYRGKK